MFQNARSYAGIIHFIWLVKGPLLSLLIEIGLFYVMDGIRGQIVLFELGDLYIQNVSSLFRQFEPFEWNNDYYYHRDIFIFNN